ncbi:MAG: hypothetical protein KF819_19170 [Labilithrix sp.]|nr:hypothetical protein [Labilithrix sp.]
MSARLMVALALVLVAGACERTKEPPFTETRAAPPPPSAAAGPAADKDAAPHTEKVEFPEVPIRSGATTTVHVKWKAPEGTGVNADAPFKVRWNRSDALAEAPQDVKATGKAAQAGFDVAVKPLDGAPNATLGGVIDLVVCDDATHSVCIPVRRAVEIEFVPSSAAPDETTVTVALPQARAR